MLRWKWDLPRTDRQGEDSQAEHAQEDQTGDQPGAGREPPPALSHVIQSSEAAL
jgi:hypothetical protein